MWPGQKTDRGPDSPTRRLRPKMNNSGKKTFADQEDMLAATYDGKQKDLMCSPLSVRSREQTAVGGAASRAGQPPAASPSARKKPERTQAGVTPRPRRRQPPGASLNSSVRDPSLDSSTISGQSAPSPPAPRPAVIAGTSTQFKTVDPTSTLLSTPSHLNVDTCLTFSAREAVSPKNASGRRTPQGDSPRAKEAAGRRRSRLGELISEEGASSRLSPRAREGGSGARHTLPQAHSGLPPGDRGDRIETGTMLHHSTARPPHPGDRIDTGNMVHHSTDIGRLHKAPQSRLTLKETNLPSPSHSRLPAHPPDRRRSLEGSDLLPAPHKSATPTARGSRRPGSVMNPPIVIASSELLERREETGVRPLRDAAAMGRQRSQMEEMSPRARQMRPSSHAFVAESPRARQSAHLVP